MRAYIKDIRQRIAGAQNPYFTALRTGAFERADFVETQVQFRGAVEHFARPMMLLAARCPTEAQRVALLDNVNDEHGRGDPNQSHSQTFRQLLIGLGVELGDLAQRRIGPEVRAFNAVLQAVCLTERPAVGLAVFGIVEDLFADVSAWIGAAVVKLGWLDQRELVHYATHEALDRTHADGFYRLIEPVYASDPSAAAAIRDGFELGAYCLERLYHDLYEQRARRM